ncbi:MAG: carbon-nitrogen hydrolase family protein, partial [Alphaproteobacteria bacterium]|nr:carbon-nitrogen hydrolase family protein [Alphaproteobacteria bacterium]
ILTPENTCLVEKDFASNKIINNYYESEHPALKKFTSLAHQLSIYLLIGSLSIKIDEQYSVNRSYLINPHGNIVTFYDKIHLFDVNLQDHGVYKESNFYAPGDCAVVANLPWGKIGLTICYDLRFPHLYRYLAQKKADFIAIPSSFTYNTGMAHWHILQRARAIETGSFIFAPAQCGKDSNGRQTFGHSMIIDPWGKVLAEAYQEPTIIYSIVEPNFVIEVRKKIPSLSVGRKFYFKDNE